MEKIKETTDRLFGQYLAIIGQIENLKEWEKKEVKKTILTILKEAPNAILNLSNELSDALYKNGTEEKIKITMSKLETQERLLQFGLPKLQFMLIPLYAFTSNLINLIKLLTESARPRVLNINQLENIRKLLDQMNKDIDKIFPRVNKLTGEMTPKDHLKRAITFLEESVYLLNSLSTNLEVLFDILPKFRTRVEMFLKGISPEKYAQIAPKIR